MCKFSIIWGSNEYGVVILAFISDKKTDGLNYLTPNTHTHQAPGTRHQAPGTRHQETRNQETRHQALSYHDIG